MSQALGAWCEQTQVIHYLLELPSLAADTQQGRSSLGKSRERSRPGTMGQVSVGVGMWTEPGHGVELGRVCWLFGDFGGELLGNGE